MKRILIWLMLAAVLAGCLLYRHYLRNKPDVAPDALQEIEKAKRR